MRRAVDLLQDAEYHDHIADRLVTRQARTQLAEVEPDSDCGTALRAVWSALFRRQDVGKQ
jgi:hypothetical protein